MDNLICPFAEHSVYIKTDGTITTCGNGQPVIDSASGRIFTTETHTAKQAFESQEFINIRENLRKGIPDRNCTKCWDLETIGAESSRLNEIRYRVDRRLEGFQVLGVSFGNQCNLKCRTCNPNDSSTWIDEFYQLDTNKAVDSKTFKKIFLKRVKENSIFFQSLVSDTLPKLTELYFFGGEPFFTKEVWSLLKHGVEAGHSHHIGIIMSTNCTIWDERVLIFDNYEHTHLAMSIDAVGFKFEYLRHPAKWNEVRKNIDKIVKWRNNLPEKRSLSLGVTLSVYNLWYLNELIDLAETLSVELFINPAHEPGHIDIGIIPERIKKQVIDRLSLIHIPRYKDEIDTIIEYLEKSVSDIDLWNEFFIDIEKRDLYRKENFRKTFTEFYQLAMNLKYYE